MIMMGRVSKEISISRQWDKAVREEIRKQISKENQTKKPLVTIDNTHLNINLNVSIDSSMSSDKLQELLNIIKSAKL